ncbi:cupin domain-containing protein, partial [Pseudoalteromonas aliena]
DSAVLLSVNGENYELPMCDLNAVKLLTDTSYFISEDLMAHQPSLEFIKPFTTLVNEGIWYN